MANYVLDESLLISFAEADKTFLRQLFAKMNSDAAALDRLSKHISDCMRERNIIDFLKLSEEMRAQACFEYIVLGMLAGDIKKADLEKCLS